MQPPTCLPSERKRGARSAGEGMHQEYYSRAGAHSRNAHWTGANARAFVQVPGVVAFGTRLSVWGDCATKRDQYATVRCCSYGSTCGGGASLGGGRGSMWSGSQACCGRAGLTAAGTTLRRTVATTGVHNLEGRHQACRA